MPAFVDVLPFSLKALEMCTLQAQLFVQNPTNKHIENKYFSSSEGCGHLRHLRLSSNWALSWHDLHSLTERESEEDALKPRLAPLSCYCPLHVKPRTLTGEERMFKQPLAHRSPSVFPKRSKLSAVVD